MKSSVRIGEYLLQSLDAHRVRHVFGIAGDHVLGFYDQLTLGAFQMTGMELATAVRYRLNPVVLVLNNCGHSTKRLANNLLHVCSLKDHLQHLRSGEFFFGKLASGGAVGSVVRVDRLDSVHRFFQRGKRQQTLSRWQMLAEARVLHQHGATRCQVANAAITEPTTARFHITVLGHAELRTRLLNVSTKTVQAAGDVIRIRQRPTAVAQLCDVFLFGFVNQQRQLNRLRRLARQFDEP